MNTKHINLNNPFRKVYILLIIMVLATIDSHAQSSYYIEQSSKTIYNAMNRGYAPWDQEKLITYNGFQYTSFWDKTNHLALSRINVTSGDVQTIFFPDSCFDITDGHRSISLGISPIDGRLHLSYDHHNNQLNYRQSAADFLKSPPATLSLSSFSSKIQMLSNATLESSITYPMFLNDKLGRLYFFYRTGYSGNGDCMFHAYNSATGVWTRTGKLISKNGSYQSIATPAVRLSTYRSAYVNDIRFDTNDRLHATFTWREDNNLPVFLTNHDVCYAYSDDFGFTWKNDKGIEVANMPKGTSITVTSPDIIVVSSPFESWIMNQGSMAFDSYNNPHVFIYRSTTITPDVAKTNQHYIHYWKDKTGVWKSQYVDDTSVIVNKDLNRGDILIGADNTINLLYFINNTFFIARSTEVNNWADWKIYPVMYGNANSVGRPDLSKWKSDGVIQLPVKLNGDNILTIKTLALSSLVPALPVLTSVSKLEKGAIVQWSPSIGALNVDIYRTSTGGTYTKIATGVSKNTMFTQYLDSTVVNGTTYSYKIKAVNDTGETDFSNELNLNVTTSYFWNFNNDGNFEGWQLTKNVTGKVLNGLISLTPIGTDPFIHSYNSLGMSPLESQFSVSMKNSTSGSMAQLFWITEESTNWSESKSITFPLKVHDPSFTNYSVDLSAHPEWKGVIKQLRFDVVNTSNVSAAESASIDWIKLSKSALPTSTNELIINENFNVFPNPASDFITVKSRLGYEMNEISIFDMTGKRFFSLLAGKSINKQLDISQLKNGIYFISVKTDVGNQVAKFIKR